MSILIKGMEMPKYTTKAEFGIDADGNPLCMIYHEDGTEPDIYDVILLPEGHGRLVDIDAVIKAICNSCDGECDVVRCDCLNCKADCRCDFMKEVSDAPTIVPAEGGGEDG